MTPLLLLASLLAQPSGAPAHTTLQVDLTLSRGPADAAEERLSYRLFVLANGSSMTELRSGREVAVSAAEGVRYRNVGVNLHCRASEVEGGFRLNVTLERSSLGVPDHSGSPTFLIFYSRSEIRVHDGQTIEVLSGADPDTGALWKIEATVRALEP